MTYDDNRNNRTNNRGNMTGWAIAGIAALAVAGIMLFSFGGDDNRTGTAQNTGDRPAATAPANPGSGTTGSGTTSPPPNR